MVGLGRVWAFGVVALAVVWSPAAAAVQDALSAEGQGRAASVAPTPIPQVRDDGSGQAAISAQSEEKLQAAFEQLYNLDFGAGLGLFEQVARAEPQSASVRAFWAAALLYEILAHQGTLESQLFVTTNEFLKQSRLPVDPELDRRFGEEWRESLAIKGKPLGEVKLREMMEERDEDK